MVQDYAEKISRAVWPSTGVILALASCVGPQPADPALESWLSSPKSRSIGNRGVSTWTSHGSLNWSGEIPIAFCGRRVLVGDSLLAMGVSGRRRSNDPDPAQINDKWHIGSIPSL